MPEQELKDGYECENCGEDHNACLDFHHTGEKNFTIGESVTRYGKDKIKEEIKKCRVLCSNCHRKEHN